jgi:S1-C subfamily serine protease
VQTPEDLLDLLGAERIGRAVLMEILRAGSRTEVTVSVGERPAQ